MAKQDKTPRFPTFSPKSAGMTVQQRREAASPSRKAPVKRPVKTVERGELENVSKLSNSKQVDTRSKSPMSSMASKAIKEYPINAPVPKVSQLASSSSSATPAIKNSRFRTALNDAGSATRGGLNLAFGKNQSQTTGGKVLERTARIGAAAMGAGVVKKAAVAGATKAITSASKAGSVNPLGIALTTAGTVAAGQAMYKNRSAESTKKGLLNPGKGKANLSINFDAPFQKTKGRDMPLPDSSSLFN